MSVRIYQLDRGFSFWLWLCPKHLAKRKREGFDVKESKDPPHADLACDDCNQSERRRDAK